jgi:hypothetical protein
LPSLEGATRTEANERANPSLSASAASAEPVSFLNSWDSNGQFPPTLILSGGKKLEKRLKRILRRKKQNQKLERKQHEQKAT